MDRQYEQGDHWISGGKKLAMQRFGYFGDLGTYERYEYEDRSLAKKISINENEDREEGTFSLATAKVGVSVRIVSLNCGSANTRLMGMGLMPGVELQVVRNGGSGSAIVALQERRLGLEAKMAQQIQVTRADSPIETSIETIKRKLTAMKETTGNGTVKLRDAAIGSTLKAIAYAEGVGNYKRKLLAMGLTPGTEFVVKRHAPLGDPIEIEVRGFRLSLRKAEAEALIIEPVEEVK
ncbi:FeoA family protein [Phormidium sp. CCY1219]|uniref:FeoA family protein n=1 Tax=Phormidium sp. CCY1219 TaxID=2886104 RepID=UPI002D1EE758|nr:ferrous iron transport protein A [Phormidium sp. CCY1219]MEB3827900.1 ferrous iron transport protein A [Phormidium sp. CCY1219]